LGTEQEGEEHLKQLDKFVLSTPASEGILFDICKMRVFGQSYAKQTLGMLFDRLREGKYESRHFFVRMRKPVDPKELKKPTKGNLLELHSAMEKVDLPILVTFESNPADFYRDYSVVGPLQENLRKVLDIVIRRREVTTAYLSRNLAESLQSASTKLSRLEDLSLITKAIPSDRRGNVFSFRRLEIE
jgi:hypothetical protein